MINREASAVLEMTIRYTEKHPQKCWLPVFTWCRERHMYTRGKSLVWQMFILTNWKITVILKVLITLKSLRNQVLWLRNTWWNVWCWEAVTMRELRCSGTTVNRLDSQRASRGSKWIRTTRRSMQHSSLKIRILFSTTIRNWSDCVKRKTLLFMANLNRFIVKMIKFLLTQENRIRKNFWLSATSVTRMQK